jgi:hypothetical protein
MAHLKYPVSVDEVLESDEIIDYDSEAVDDIMNESAFAPEFSNNAELSTEYEIMAHQLFILMSESNS